MTLSPAFFNQICKIFSKNLHISKIVRNFALAFEPHGPFVYRLGRKIFILERGVRLSYGLLIIKETD